MRIVLRDEVLVEFSFVSSLRDFVTRDALAQMERRFWEFNVRNRISGSATHCAGRITQSIEGSPEVVLPLAACILSDHRHTGISILTFGAIATRRFASWHSTGFGAPSNAAAIQHCATCNSPENVYVLHESADSRKFGVVGRAVGKQS
jgi:hypothetical protein